MIRTAAVILAAGNSSRMGTPKQLLLYHGEPLLKHAAEVANASSVHGTIVVLGANDDQVRGTLRGLDVSIVSNPLWQSGMGTSIHAGVRAAQEADMDAVVLMLADQPLVSASVINRLIATFSATKMPIIASQYSDTVGVPAFFHREFFPHLLALPPDQGCKALIVSKPEKTIRLHCPEAEGDVDTPADYERITQSTSSSKSD